MGPSLTDVAESWVSGRGAAFWSLDSDWGVVVSVGSGFWILGFWKLGGQERGSVGRRILDSWILEPAGCRSGDGGTSDLGFLDSGFCCA